MVRWWWRTRRTGKWIQTSWEAVHHSAEWRGREKELEQLEEGEILTLDELRGYQITKRRVTDGMA